MALDGILLSKIIPQIQAALPLRIQKIQDVSPTELLFHTHGSGGRKQLLISCHSVYNRLMFTDRSYQAPWQPGNFVMVLRKYIEGGMITDLKQVELDRWCRMEISRRNNLGDPETLYLYIELMGKYANVILVSSENRIIDALKRIPPFENSRRTIHPGAVFEPTPSQNKKDPFAAESFDPEISLTRQFSGFSPFLSREIEYRMEHGETFASVMQEIRNSDRLYIAAENQEPLFHCIELKHCGTNVSYPLFEGFDVLYYRREEKDRIRQVSGDIYHYVNRQLRHQQQKLPKLFSELDDAKDCDKWKKYGDLLFTWQVDDTKGRTSVSLEDYETGEPVDVPLDPKLDGKANARKAYQRYNKLKKAQSYLEEQIRICQDETAYFEGLIEQLDMADFATATEIQEELQRLGYMKNSQKRKKTNRRRKETKAAVTTVTAPSGIRISFGKNNFQNDELTWHQARKNELWLHAKDYHGAHVVIHDEHPDEDTIRLAANIAASFSAGRHSSSVPIVYCPQRNLKKIPGAKPGTVQLGNYRMIYIDPDPEPLYSCGAL
ncbi:MAG: fibronectin/fibrinogen-binding protein [Erysipelotrichaceae bacterium]|nr:fibronectin/fibrinogen-binding protein [Erysipelotrichaceae bacterium]